ncbi:sigma-70 family RNA polymerase sigma factor [Pedobacter sp. AW31-3R]|uniref:sigma-70 family RNA polymerase sigma factor n=1 Tax=Pedobacter sp. AW31-3R TaxID=3445781 RepID=UPI003F9FE97C
MPVLTQDLSAVIYKVATYHCEVSYKQLFHALYPGLSKFSFAIVNSHELAEEIAGDVMIQLWRNRDNLLNIKNIQVYTFVMAKNLSLNALRVKAGYTISLDEIDVEISINTHTPEQILITDDLKKILERSINSLPPRCKRIFKLVKEDGLSYKEAAQILNVSTKTVDAQLVTALKRIATALQTAYKLV